MKISRLLVLISSVAVIAATMTGCSSANSVSEIVLPDTSGDIELTETIESSEYIGRYTLSYDKSDEITQRVYDYVCDNYGSVMISSQQESTWMGSPDYEMVL